MSASRRRALPRGARPARGVQLGARYAWFAAGEFLEDTGPSEDIHFVRVELNLSF